MTPYAPYPLGRPRRLRFDDFTRRMVREYLDQMYIPSLQPEAEKVE